MIGCDDGISDQRRHDESFTRPSSNLSRGKRGDRDRCTPRLLAEIHTVIIIIVVVIMVALCNRADHYIFILFLLSSFFFFLA